MKTSVTYSRQMIKYAKEVLEDIQKLVKELCNAVGDIEFIVYKFLAYSL